MTDGIRNKSRKGGRPHGPNHERQECQAPHVLREHERLVDLLTGGFLVRIQPEEPSPLSNPHGCVPEIPVGTVY